MPAKTSTPASLVGPPIGTLIDGGTLELVELLGVGGYGVVYRAVDIRSLRPKSYAVKCLLHSPKHQNSRQRHLHIREITLHQLTSTHANVVSLHRVIEEMGNTYLIMDFASDGDLFSQILHNSRYLGEDYLIKHVFLQILDAVEHCHSLGIYHRDLKPENVLCFDDGLRVAITDFGLATTEKVSEEFRTGSVYHMSPDLPECQGGTFSPNGTYSPLANDVWSLAIILLNLATGRNPWKSATETDPTFQAYLQDPDYFLPTVLPISAEANNLLVHMLHVDWRKRISLREVRQALDDIDTFYSEGVIFEGSMARCRWEAGMEIESDSSTKGNSMEEPAKNILDSYWSEDSCSEMVFASPSTVESLETDWMEYSSSEATWGIDDSEFSSPCHPRAFTYIDSSGAPQTPPSTRSPMSSSGSGSLPTPPATPNSVDMPFAFGVDFRDKPSKPLTIDTNCCGKRFYDSSATPSSESSIIMRTAIESYEPYSSSYYLASATPSSRLSYSMPSTDMPRSSTMDDREMDDVTSSWEFSSESFPSISNGEDPSIISADSNVWPESRTRPMLIPRSAPSLFYALSNSFRSRTPSPSPKKGDGKPKGSGLFRFAFPRSPPISPIPTTHLACEQQQSESFSALAFYPPLTPPSIHSSTDSKPPVLVAQDGNCRKAARPRTARHWFSPGKLFATGAS